MYYSLSLSRLRERVGVRVAAQTDRCRLRINPCPDPASSSRADDHACRLEHGRRRAADANQKRLHASIRDDRGDAAAARQSHSRVTVANCADRRLTPARPTSDSGPRRSYATCGSRNSKRVPRRNSELTRTTLPCRSSIRLTMANPRPELVLGPASSASVSCQ